MQKLVVIDGNSLMHRAYYALPGMTTQDGFPTGALHGFLSMLLKLTASQSPDYLLVAFDMHGPTFRHETYAEYKAGRKETPEDLRKQFPVLKDLLCEMGITVCECPRYEADDILGTFARRCESEGIRALLVTGDRDALQLISENTHVLITKKGISDTVEYDTETLLEAYGLTPDRMRDLKGLMGDSSDNIPGIPGVGEKTALKLLQEYGSMENILSHAHEVKGKLGEKLAAYAESARMSYRIGTIDTNAPVSIPVSACKLHPEGFAAARKHLAQLELRAIIDRLPKTDVAHAAEPDAPAAQQAMTAIDSLDALHAAIEGAHDKKCLALLAGDGIQFAFSEVETYLLAFGEDLFSAAIDDRDIWQAFAPWLTDPSKRLLTFDSKSLRHAAANFGITVQCDVFDAMIADYLINAIRPSGSFSALAERQLHTEHACASQLFVLEKRMLQTLEQTNMLSLYADMELPLSKVLFQMEQEGFLVDSDMLLALQTQFAERIRALEKGIFDAAGETFNILSPKQLGEVLFVKLGLPTMRKTKTGYSTDADTLEALSAQHPIVKPILEYRFLCKLKSTFLDALLAQRSLQDGRVRTSFNQCVTATGRISSTEPNLQNIPVRSELGREIRKAFVASDGNRLVGADYSQIELRILAHISNDQNMLDAFRSGDDFHTRTASEVFNVPIAEVTGEMRSAAKAVNFGIVYGISDFGLAKNLGIPVKQASAYIHRYFERFPGVKRYLDESVAEAKALGYAKTLFHRRRDMPELTSSNHNTRAFGERVAMNMPIQGTAADIIKLAMVHVTDALKAEGLGAKLILQVHDELIFDTPMREVDAVMRIVHSAMENVCKLSVSLTAEVKTGNSWYDTK